MVPAQKIKTKVAAVKCTCYETGLVQKQVEKAISEAGGFHPLIKAGSKVLIKPNFLAAKPPEAAVTTHPEIVRAIIRILKKRGVKNIVIGDSPASCNCNWKELWQVTGFKDMAKEEKVPILAFDNIKIVETEDTGPVPILKELETFDAMISVPKLKTHILTKMTGAVKNSFGLVIGGAKSNFHGQYQSPRKMAGFLATLYSTLTPEFVIMDAVVCMEGDGPADGRPKECGLIFASTDAVALDACACEVYQYTPDDIPLLIAAAKNSFGTADIKNIEKTGDGWEQVSNVKGKHSKADFIHKIPEKFFLILSFLLQCRPVIAQPNCKRCGKCEEVCPQKAIRKRGDQYYVTPSRCILCMCCLEACPHHAINLLSIAQKFIRLIRKIIPGK